MTKFLICSPTHDGSVRSEYMKSVMALTDWLREQGIAWELVMESSSILHVMRSVMASKALADDEVTHLLFIDTDMGFSVSTVRRMLAAGKDVIGCAYPYRTIPLQEEVSQAGTTLRQAIGEAVTYAVSFGESVREISVTDGICDVKMVGTGLMLIRREALAVMRDKGRVQTFRNRFPFKQWFKADSYIGFFDHIAIDGAYYSEDFSFCIRWTEYCGGKVFALVDEEIMHVGGVPVIGRYIDRIKTGKV